MKNLNVRGMPASTHKFSAGDGSYSLKASVQVEYRSSDAGDEYAWQTSTFVLTPQARVLVLELLAAVELAEPPPDKKTAATGALAGDGPAGEGKPASDVSASGVHVREDATTVAPEGDLGGPGAPRLEPDNRGGNRDPGGPESQGVDRE